MTGYIVRADFTVLAESEKEAKRIVLLNLMDAELDAELDDAGIIDWKVPLKDVAVADDTHPCEDCGETYFEQVGSYWLASNELWETVIGDVSITLCPGCFATRAREEGRPIYWRADEEVRPRALNRDNAATKP